MSPLGHRRLQEKPSPEKIQSWNGTTRTKFSFWIPWTGPGLRFISRESNITVKLIKENSDLLAEIICKYFNESLEKSKFPDCLKLANVTPVFKKGARTSKNNYRPVSILPILSKLLEGLISKQLSEFLKVYYRNFSVVLGKVMVPNTVF